MTLEQNKNKLYVIWNQNYDDPIFIKALITEDMFENYFSIRYDEFKEKYSDPIKYLNHSVIKNTNSISFIVEYTDSHLRDIYKHLSEQRISELKISYRRFVETFEYQLVEVEV